MSYAGDFLAGDVVRLKFTTVDSTGAPTTLSGSPAVTVYKDGSLTQSSVGVTLTVDFDAVTGRNLVVIDTTDDTNFYTDGSQFYAELSVGTIGGVSAIGYPAGNFTLGAILAYDLPNRTDQLVLEGLIGALPTDADVKAQVVAALATDIYAVPGQEAPPTNPTISQMLLYIFKLGVNAIEQSSTEFRLFNRAGTVVEQKAPASEVGGIASRGSLTSGP